MPGSRCWMSETRTCQQFCVTGDELRVAEGDRGRGRKSEIGGQEGEEPANGKVVRRSLQCAV